MHILTRVTNLVRGTLAQWIRRREHRNPAAVYEAAIEERVKQYDALRHAAAGVIYLRGKLARELDTATEQLANLEARLELAVDRDDDRVALSLITRRDELRVEVRRLTGELTELTGEAEAAKRNHCLP
jgi:phage shock protein A